VRFRPGRRPEGARFLTCALFPWGPLPGRPAPFRGHERGVAATVEPAWFGPAVGAGRAAVSGAGAGRRADGGGAVVSIRSSRHPCWSAGVLGVRVGAARWARRWLSAGGCRGVHRRRGRGRSVVARGPDPAAVQGAGPVRGSPAGRVVLAVSGSAASGSGRGPLAQVARSSMVAVQGWNRVSASPVGAMAPARAHSSR